MKRIPTLLFLLATLIVGPAIFANGAPKMPKMPKSPELSPQQKAIQAFNQGVAHRDKAWKFEKALKTETNAKKAQKLETRIQKEYRKAIDDYEAAIGHDPNMFQAHGSLGYALRKSGDYARSLEAYNKALELAPGYAEAIEYRGEAYLGLDRVDDAKVAYLTLLNGGSELAGELLAAMREYVDGKKSSGSDVAEFAEWVERRESLVKMKGATASAGGSW